jgi:hypothetical protein
MGCLVNCLNSKTKSLLHLLVGDRQRAGKIFVTALEVNDAIIGLTVLSNIFDE